MSPGREGSRHKNAGSARQRERERVEREGEGGSVDRVVENKLRYDLIELGPLEKCCQSIECKNVKDLRLVI